MINSIKEIVLGSQIKFDEMGLDILIKLFGKFICE